MLTLTLNWDRPTHGSDRPEPRVLRIELSLANLEQSLPCHVAVAIDASGSMQVNNKIAGARAACVAIAERLRPADRLSLASYSYGVNRIIEDVPGGSECAETVRAAVSNVQAHGTTRMDLAIEWLRERLSQVPPGAARLGILGTDGHPTEESGELVEDTSSLLDAAALAAGAEGQLFCVGLGDANDFNCDFLQTLAERGRGRLLFAQEAQTLATEFEARLQSAQQIAVPNAQVEIKVLRASDKLRMLCRHDPDYLALDPVDGALVSVGPVAADRPTILLARLQVTQEGFGVVRAKDVVQVRAVAGGAWAQQKASIKFGVGLREAQQLDDAVHRADLIWSERQLSRGISQSDDPRMTGDLLTELEDLRQALGDVEGAKQAESALDDLRKTGQLSNLGKTTILTEAYKDHP